MTFVIMERKIVSGPKMCGARALAGKRGQTLGQRISAIGAPIYTRFFAFESDWNSLSFFQLDEIVSEKEIFRCSVGPCIAFPATTPLGTLPANLFAGVGYLVSSAWKLSITQLIT